MKKTDTAFTHSKDLLDSCPSLCRSLDPQKRMLVLRICNELSLPSNSAKTLSKVQIEIIQELILYFCS